MRIYQRLLLEKCFKHVWQKNSNSYLLGLHIYDKIKMNDPEYIFLPQIPVRERLPWRLYIFSFHGA